jgi:hypothetical protein
MGKAVAAKMHAAIPAGHDHDMIDQPRPLQHLKDNRAGPRFAVVVLHRPRIRKHACPSVVCGLGEFLGAFQFHQKCLSPRAALHGTA